ncbi:hypothetical protein [Mycobacterium bourgelatii]|nr:hypothetical protein [Mycobacterium bourgelatii]
MRRQRNGGAGDVGSNVGNGGYGGFSDSWSASVAGAATAARPSA